MTYELDATLRQAPSETIGTPPISLNDEAIEEAVREGQASDTDSGSPDEGGVPATVPSTAPSSADTVAADTAGQLLSQLGVSDATSGRVNSVRVRKVLVEVDLDG
jgi:hypothetical protein